jgi:uncharacterized protein with FMN-binding domain
VRRAAIATVGTTVGMVLMLSLKPHHTDAPAARAPSGRHTAPATASGTYTGQIVHTRYGPVQVEVTLSHGRLTRVKALRLPSANGHDRQVAADAVPKLTREALAAQSADIDTVSGASYTSDGYRQSLQSALDSAGGAHGRTSTPHSGSGTDATDGSGDSHEEGGGDGA